MAVSGGVAVSGLVAVNGRLNVTVAVRGRVAAERRAVAVAVDDRALRGPRATPRVPDGRTWTPNDQTCAILLTLQSKISTLQVLIDTESSDCHVPQLEYWLFIFRFNLHTVFFN